MVIVCIVIDCVYMMDGPVMWSRSIGVVGTCVW